MNTSFKHHAIISAIVSIWLVVFLVIIAPFDVADLTFSIRLLILPPYGLISFLIYLAILPFQQKYVRRFNRWAWKEEIAFLLAYILLVFVATFMYYRSDIINGDYPFWKFTIEVFSSIAVLLITLLIVLRQYLFKKKINPPDQLIRLYGENKLDVLQIKKEDLIAVSSADNYVTIHYLNNQKAHKKLLRNTLKNMKDEVPFLVKVHRSHLVNPAHIVSWKDHKTISVTHGEIPVSKNFQKDVKALTEAL